MALGESPKRVSLWFFSVKQHQGTRLPGLWGSLEYCAETQRERPHPQQTLGKREPVHLKPVRSEMERKRKTMGTNIVSPLLITSTDPEGQVSLVIASVITKLHHSVPVALWELLVNNQHSNGSSANTMFLLSPSKRPFSEHYRLVRGPWEPSQSAQTGMCGTGPTNGSRRTSRSAGSSGSA